MAVEIITKEDLHAFRLLLLNDIRALLNVEQKQDSKEWLRSSEVRKLLNVSAGTLQNLRISGKLNPTKIGGSYFYKHREIQDLLGGTSTNKGRAI